MKYLVFDGYALCYRAFYGYPLMYNNKGRVTNVTVGFFRMVNSIVYKNNLYDYKLVFVFDSASETFRKKIYPSYKGNRHKREQVFYDQVEEVVNLCSKVWTVYRKEGYEADDLAGSFVSRYVKPDDKCLMVTVDKDWFQLLDKNVDILFYSTTREPRLVTQDSYFTENGLLPKSVIDVKALLGDDSDNIPGIKGIGWVKVQSLLQRYETVEAIYENILMIPNKGKLQFLLMQNKEQVLLNKELVTIVRTLQLTPPILDMDSNKFCQFLDYLDYELNATNLANDMGVMLQREVTV